MSKPKSIIFYLAIMGSIAAVAFAIAFIEVGQITRRHPGIDQVLNQTFFGWFNYMSVIGKVCIGVFMTMLIGILSTPFWKRKKR